MVFNSLTFIVICLFPSVILYLIVEKTMVKYRIQLENLILLMFSMLFYAWSNFDHLKVLILLILINYMIGLLSKRWRMVLLLGVLFNVSVLIYYKYLDLIISSFNSIVQSDFDLIETIAPLGVSFIIFQCISYLLDLYQGKAEPCRDLLGFSLYLSFFPKIAQGPIVKYKDMIGEIQERHIEFDRFVQGIERFVIGLSKKVLIADILASTVDDIYYSLGIGMDAGSAWLAVFCFSIQLYMDFSGYSDMAIGLGMLFGFHFKENFRFPYLSTSIGEFWRRWHISLGQWFKDYLYIPMGGSRKGNVYIHLFIVFLVTGIWHGAAWIYLLWGMLHGICVVTERYIMKKSWYGKIPTFIKWSATFFIVNIGWIAFKVPDVASFWEFLGCMIGLDTPVSFTWRYYLTPKLVVLLLIPFLGQYIFSRKKVQEISKKWNADSAIFNLIKYMMLLLLIFLCFITMISVDYSPFLYFQF